jgi:hypothetical protein
MGQLWGPAEAQLRWHEVTFPKATDRSYARLLDSST